MKLAEGEFLLVQVYVDDIIFGSSNPKLCREFEALMHNKFKMSVMGELNFFLGLQVLQKNDGIFLSQDQYVVDILKKFGLSDIRPDSCLLSEHVLRHQVTPKSVNSCYKKSTTGGCQFLGRRLISWQCKKQTIVATSTTKAEYVAAASGCGQVLWIQNQLLDYGYNFMNTKIYIDNNSAICIVKNPVYHSKTKHIEIRHHFIRDCYEKKLINVDHIHTDENVADLLTKAFDVGRFQYLVDEHAMMRYALTVRPTVNVSHIQQFWSTARVETVDGETKIIAKVNGRQRTVTESSIRRHLKLHDDEGIITLPDNEIFENLSLMGYNILPNQRFSFQKGQFSHQWKFLIHTIMQCLSPKSTGFNEFSSNIATAIVCLATNRVYNFSKMIFDGMMRNVKSKGKFLMYPMFIEKLLKMSQFGAIKHNEGEGSENPTDPHHTPSAQYESTPQEDQTTSPEPISQATTLPSQSHPDISTPKRLTRGAIRISQSKAPTPGADETASPIRDNRHREAFPTATSLDAGQDRENIAKTSAMPHEASPGVTSLSGGEGTITLPSQSHPDISTPRRLARGAIWISQSKAPTHGADETASPTRDDRHGEAFPTITSLDAGQNRENIAKTSAMPHEASPGVTSLGGGEGSILEIHSVRILF
ncbi:putative ribonuclease H-like domain-containing protein [Tanacetum coccineum]